MEEQKVQALIHINLLVVWHSRGDGHKGSRQFIEEYLRDLLVNQLVIGNEGSPGGSSHENLELVLVNPLTRKRRGIRFPE